VLNSIDKALHAVNGSDPALSVHAGPGAVYRQLPTSQQVSALDCACFAQLTDVLAKF